MPTHTQTKKENYLDTSSPDVITEFFKDYDLIEKETLEDGTIRLTVEKKRKCKNCVWWVPLKTRFKTLPLLKVGACGNEDLDQELRKTAAARFNCSPDDEDLMVVAFKGESDHCINFRRKKRTWGGVPLDERRSIFLVNNPRYLRGEQNEY